MLPVDELEAADDPNKPPVDAEEAPNDPKAPPVDALEAPNDPKVPPVDAEEAANDPKAPPVEAEEAPNDPKAPPVDAEEPPKDPKAPLATASGVLVPPDVPNVPPANEAVGPPPVPRRTVRLSGRAADDNAALTASHPHASTLCPFTLITLHPGCSLALTASPSGVTCPAQRHPW